jgi:hypothetical protein
VLAGFPAPIAATQRVNSLAVYGESRYRAPMLFVPGTLTPIRPATWMKAA